MVCCELSMECKKCGAVVPEGLQFCRVCGEMVTAPVTEVVETVAEPQAEITPEEGVETPAFDTPDFDQPAPKKKIKWKRWVLSGVAVVAAAAVVLCAFNWKWVTTWFTDAFGEPADLRDTVITREIDPALDSATAGYGVMLDNWQAMLQGEKSTSATVQLVCGDTAKDLLAEFLSIEDDAEIEALFALLEEVYIAIDSGHSDGVTQLALKAGLSSKELFSVVALMDILNGEAYLGLPSFSDLYLDLSELMEGMPTAGVEQQTVAQDVLDALPSAEAVNALLKKYIHLALEEFDDVSKEDDTLKVGRLEQKVTALETKITERDLMKAAMAIAEELLEDDDVKDIIQNVGNAMSPLAGYEDGYGERLYQDVTDRLSDAVASLDAAMDSDSTSSGSRIRWTQYLNASYDTVGMKLTVGAGMQKVELVSYAAITKGKDCAFEMEIPMLELVISGDGTNQKGVINGRYDVEIGEETYATIKVSDYDIHGAEDGTFKGTFEIIPEKELLEDLLDSLDMPSSIGSVMAMLELGLEVRVNSTSEEATVQVGITNKSETLMGIKVTVKVTEDTVSLPAPEDTVGVDEAQAWLQAMDMTSLMETLEELGIPADALEGLLDELASSLEDVDSDDDYDYDYDDYYDDYYDYDSDDGYDDGFYDDLQPIYGADGRVIGWE